MRADVTILGVINDCKFTVAGEGSIDPQSGEGNLELRYSTRLPDWSPLNYSDPLILLAAYREVDGGLNFKSLATHGYRAESTFDFGGGLSLRKTATVQIMEDALKANYSIVGAARVGHITGVQPYEEYLIPLGDGQLIAVGVATWTTTGDPVQALVSTRYWLDQPAKPLTRPQIRGFEVDAALSDDGTVYTAKYRTFVKPMPQEIMPHALREVVSAAR